MSNIFKTLLFGKPVEGEAINLDPKYKPAFKVTYPNRKPDFNTWARKLNVSYMYDFKPASKTTYTPNLNSWL